jgi:hypothetical protein
MRKNNNIIEINDHHYDARTGESLTPPGSRRTTSPTSPVKHPVGRQLVPKQPYAAMRSIRHNAAHRPATSRTLMRQAVKKPRPAAKHHLKAHGHTDTLARQALARVVPKQSALQLDEARWQHAKHITKSKLISRFPPMTAVQNNQPHASPADFTGYAPLSGKLGAPAGHQVPTPRPATSLQKHRRTTEELLEHALQQATSYQELPVKRHRFKPRRHVSISL